MLVILTVLAGLCFALAPATAHASEDSITEMSVDFDIQPDGSVDVRYELDWRFGTQGRHGIDFGIATRERWDADPTQDVLYDVSDIRVSSPSGAPDSFSQTVNGEGSVGSLDLRIGDPDKTVEGRDATYVIAYTLRGALRTFDGRPEFFWDVTGNDYPDIEEFSVTVTAPGGVQEARCLVGERECGSTIDEDAGVLTGTDVPSSTVVSVAAALAPGAVSDADPVLENRRLEYPILTGISSAVTVTADGMSHVEQELVYLLPDVNKRPPLLLWELPVRRPFSRTEDQVFRITNLTVEGAVEVEQGKLTASDRTDAHQNMKLRVQPQVSGGSSSTLTLSYDVEGSIDTDGGIARAQWILAPDALNEASSVDFRWILPAGVERAGCLRLSEFSDVQRECGPAMKLEISGDTVSWEPDGTDTSGMFDAWVSVDVPAASVGQAGPLLEPGFEAAQSRDRTFGIVGGLIGVGGTAGVVILLAGVRVRRDRRWADVPPGVTAVAGAPVRVVRRDDVVPVRFDAPDCTLAMAGLVLDGAPSSRHTGALLVHMAVQGAIALQSEPLKVRGITSEPLTDPLERQVYGEASLSDSALNAASLSAMNDAVATHQRTLLEDRAMFGPGGPASGVIAGHNAVVWGFVLVMVAAFPVTWWLVPGWLGSWGVLIAAGVVAGCALGLLRIRDRRPRRALEPDGTALRDQVQGFRLYIETAEARQLNFEADQDIYRRYLPWAVLFDLTQRWTKVCGDLAAAGRIPALDTSFWMGADSPAAMANEMSSLSSSLHAVGASSSSSSGDFFSGGGSGGSSGFSGGSSGGGGGGGTSASSW